MDDQHSNGAARFKDQVALVVGGAQGIGKSIGVRLGREGAQVAIADIDCPMMEATAREMRAEGMDTRCVPCDVRDSRQVQAMVKQVMDWRGRIDVLMYVAGIAPAVPFLDISDETWDDTVDINLRGAFLVSKAVAPHMVARKRGKLSLSVFKPRNRTGSERESVCGGALGSVVYQ